MRKRDGRSARFQLHREGCHEPSGVSTIKFEFIKQLFCSHRWVKQPNHRQIHKDSHQILWFCPECKKQIERPRWDPPKRDH